MVNKHVFITGGSEGLGLSIAKRLFLKGALVTIVSRNEDKLKKAAKEIDSTGKLVQYFVLDVAKATVGEVEEVVKKAERTHGPINTLVNNAGLSKPGMVLESDAL
jgi:short-subunit dehydrogenase